jgi:hypothetical protein
VPESPQGVFDSLLLLLDAIQGLKEVVLAFDDLGHKQFRDVCQTLTVKGLRPFAVFVELVDVLVQVDYLVLQQLVVPQHVLVFGHPQLDSVSAGTKCCHLFLGGLFVEDAGEGRDRLAQGVRAGWINA